MTSTLTLYYNTKLLPDKNLALDNAGSGKGIHLYLQTVTSKAISGFQYVKHGLSISIRFNESQAKLAMGAGAEDLNYCRIQNGTENPIYYFVVGKSWKSQNTIELSLVMDTLNSFEYNVDYPLSAKTMVQREHHDRLAAIITGDENLVSFGPYARKEESSSWSFFITNAYTQAEAIDTIENDSRGGAVGHAPDPSFVCTTFEFRTIDGKKGIYLEGTHTAGSWFTILVHGHGPAYRIIHKPSEGIQAPKRKTSSEVLSEEYAGSWNLLYRNKDIPDDQNQYDNPVECVLVPDTPLYIKTPVAEGVIDSDVISNGEIMLIFAEYGQFVFEVDDVQYIASSEVSDGAIPVRRERAYAIQNDGGTFKLYEGYFTLYSSIASGSWIQIATASSAIKVKNKSVIDVRIASALPTANEIRLGSLYSKSAATSQFTLTSDGTQTILGLESIDRTDPRNIKLIKCPYAPSNITVDSSGFVTLSGEWVFDSNANVVKLGNPNVRFSHEVAPICESSIITPMLTCIEGRTVMDERSIGFESKLLHSDFHNPKFSYDSFVKNFDLERIDARFLPIDDPTFRFTFVMSRNIVSKFLFDFTQYVGYHVEDTQDFNHIVCVARNNEEVLYSSQYLDYLRTGYNYDLKTKERTEVSAGVGIGLNVAALMASIGISFIPGAQGIGLASAAASGFGLASQLVNYAKTIAQNEQNIAQKLQETQMQAVSVQNADDVDLLDYYCGNSAIFFEYDISDEMRTALWDLFHYCGYKTDLQKVPDKSTRYWFNFVQADLVFVDTANLNSDLEDDLKARFKDGVTFLHYREGYGFDFDQEKENWEIAVVPYLDEPED